MFIEQPRQMVSRPGTTEWHGGQCWVKIRVPSTNRSFVKTYVQCSKARREDKLTCHHHDKFENEARELKWMHEYNQQRVADFKRKFEEQHGRPMSEDEQKKLGIFVADLDANRKAAEKRMTEILTKEKP